MSQKMIVRTEYCPTRCEICHQSDMFNPQTNWCNRCESNHYLPTPTNHSVKIITQGAFIILTCASIINILAGHVVYGMGIFFFGNCALIANEKMTILVKENKATNKIILLALLAVLSTILCGLIVLSDM